MNGNSRFDKWGSGKRKGGASTCKTGVSIKIFIRTQQTVSFFPSSVCKLFLFTLLLFSCCGNDGFLVRVAVAMASLWCLHQSLQGFRSISVLLLNSFGDSAWA